MSDFTMVNAGAMQAGIGDLTSACGNLESLLNDLKGQLGASLNQWDGAARTAYSDVQRQWDASAAHMHEIIGKMGSVLGQISDGYNTNERQIQGNWS